MTEQAVKLYGTDEPGPERRVLTAGPVTATFEAGQLRWIKIGDAEAIRAIAFLVRDRNWSTPVPEIRDLDIVERGGGFRVRFTAVCRTPDGEFTWRGEYAGKRDGTIRCVATGSPERDFMTGRTGFVILHPLANFAGAPVEIEHVDGTKEKSIVPETIASDQPFFLVRAMTHSPKRGIKATVRMTGDSWETEDQRNWTDASFKTYSRPLSLPWPYQIKAGETVRQTVTLSFSGKLPSAPAKEGGAVSVALGRVGGVMPAVGLSVLPEDAKKALRAADIVKAARVAHLNCRVDLRRRGWEKALSAYGDLAQAAGAKIVLEIVLQGTAAPAEELAPVAKAAKDAGMKLSAVVVTPAADLKSYPPGVPIPKGVPSWQEIAAAARRAFPRVRLGGGMLSNFTEINRKRPPKKLFDFITHATSGLVHAADDRSVMETLESVAHVIRSAKKIAGSTPTRIGPSHIGNSFNPYGASTTENPKGGRVTMARVEPRHRGLFGAAWHLGFLGQAANGGVEAATLASPAGEFGIATQKLGHAQPWFDDAAGAKVYPLFHVIRGVAKAAGAKRIAAESSDTDRLRALAWRKGKTTELWLANLSAAPLNVRLKDVPGGEPRIAVLDAESFEKAAGDPVFMDKTAPLKGKALALPAFAVARLVF